MSDDRFIYNNPAEVRFLRAEVTKLREENLALTAKLSQKRTIETLDLAIRGHMDAMRPLLDEWKRLSESKD